MIALYLYFCLIHFPLSFAKITFIYYNAKFEMSPNGKKSPKHTFRRLSLSKEAATYSPALHCSTIGASGLNFSVRNGKR